MDVYKETIDDYEILIWEAIRSLSDVKQKTILSPQERKEELRILQNELMEASEWMNSIITE